MKEVIPNFICQLQGPWFLAIVITHIFAIFPVHILYKECSPTLQLSTSQLLSKSSVDVIHYSFILTACAWWMMYMTKSGKSWIMSLSSHLLCWWMESFDPRQCLYWWYHLVWCRMFICICLMPRWWIRQSLSLLMIVLEEAKRVLQLMLQM